MGNIYISSVCMKIKTESIRKLSKFFFLSHKIVVQNNFEHITFFFTQGSQIRQIWRILCRNFSDDSKEVTEGVTSTPEIFGNKHSFVLTFFA